MRDALSRLNLPFNPAVIISDFEAALLETIRLQFPNARHLGCHFHYGQCIWRKVQDVGLAGEYNAGGNVQAFIQKCIALAFIPPSEVNDKFHELVHRLSDEEQTKLASFIDYFRATWLGGMFPIPMWNKYGTVRQHRTNNAMESWHASLRRLLPTHPNLFIFIHVIKTQQAFSKILVCQADGGKSPSKPKLKYRQLDERICKVTAKHVHGDIDTDALLSKIQHYVNTSKH